MRRIFTLFMAMVCLFATQNLFAQCTYTTTTTAPTATPTYTAATPGSLQTLNTNSVPLATGWWTINATPYTALITTGGNVTNPTNNAGNATFRLYSTNYYFNSPSSTLSFYIAVNTANESNQVKVSFNNINLYYGATPTSVTLCSGASSANNQAANTTIYYAFTFTLGTALPALTNFRIGMDITISSQSNIGTNYLSFPSFGLTGSTSATISAATLPVHFSSISVSKASEGAQLTWNVGTEQNVSGYDVEKSTDGRSFTKVGFVAASGQSAYTFTDTKTGALNFYRVKSIDIDGKFGYSTIVSLNGDNASVVVKAFLSDKNTLTVQHDAAVAGSRISVVSMDGRIVKVQQPSTGAQQTKIDLSAAQAGLYIIRYDNGQGGTQSIKVAK